MNLRLLIFETESINEFMQN